MKILLYFLIFDAGALFGLVMTCLFTAAGNADKQMGIK